MNSLTWREVKKYLNRALAGVNYILTIAVSVVVVIIAVVLFRALVNDPSTTSGTTTTSTTESPQGATSSAPVVTTRAATAPPTLDCVTAEPQPDPGNETIKVFFACGPSDEPTGATWVYRQVATEDRLLAETVRHIVAGPTPEERKDGFRSLFTPATADAVINASRDGGAVTVNLRALGPMPSLASSTDGDFFLADLNNTIFQLEVIETIEYQIEGSCEEFWEYFDIDGCRVINRLAWVDQTGAAEAI